MTSQHMLNTRQKAAVIVRLLLDDESGSGLDRMNSDSQTKLAQEMAEMDLVDRATRDSVIAEFCDMLDEVGVTFPGDIDGTLEMLGARISDDTSDRLRRIATFSGSGDPWARVQALPEDAINQLAASEAAELVAVMLSKLSIAHAAKTFASLSRDKARLVAQAMALTGELGAPALRRIGLALVQAAEALPVPAIAEPTSNRMGEILNFATAELRDDVLETLDTEDEVFAGDVRKAIFVFAHIPKRITPRDIPTIIRETDQQTLLRALSSSSEEDAAAAQFILSNLSQRMADNLREEMESLARPSATDIEQAGAEVISTIRRLVAGGEIDLIIPDEDE